MTDNQIATARSKLLEARKTLSLVLEGEKTRKRGAIMRQLHEVRQMLSRQYPFSSQAGQDLIVDQIMGQKRGGTFVDIVGPPWPQLAVIVAQAWRKVGSNLGWNNSSSLCCVHGFSVPENLQTENAKVQTAKGQAQTGGWWYAASVFDM